MYNGLWLIYEINFEFPKQCNNSQSICLDMVVTIINLTRYE